MKKLLIALMSTLAISAQASEYVGRIVEAGCNTRYGVGEVHFAFYDKDTKSMTMVKANVVSDELCKKNSTQASKLVEIAMDSVLGGEVDQLHKITLNSVSIVKKIETVDATSRSLRKIYSKFNLLDLNNYKKADFRVVDQLFLGFDKATIERVPGLIEMGKLQ